MLPGMPIEALRNPTSLRTPRVLILALATVAALVLPAGASAAPTCAYDSGTSDVTVTMDGAGQEVGVSAANGVISMFQSSGTTACGAATLGNTDRINAVDQSGGGDTTFRIDEGAGEFSHNGVRIRFGVVMMGGTGDRLIWRGGPGADHVRAGDLGVNLNATLLPLDFTVELEFLGVEELTLQGEGGNDVLSAAGGAGSGNALALPVRLDGVSGDDSLTGGEAPILDTLHGGDGNDILLGAGGMDRISPGQGDDSMDGGAGFDDEVTYQGEPAGVTVSLGAAGPQATGSAGTDTILGGIEELIGTAHDDVLGGSAGGDRIFGDAGDDRIEGRGGPDELWGCAGACATDGADRIDGGPGADYMRGEESNDVLDGGPGDDSLWGDEGIDTLSYATAAAGVTVDLATGGDQDTGGAGKDTIPPSNENLEGSPFDDQLTGNDDPNVITGLGGGDLVDAAGGADLVELRDATGDAAVCGDALDIVRADESGIDVLVGCELVDTLPSTVIAGGPAGSTNDATPTFTLESNEPGSSFECSLDGGPFEQCPATHTTAPLADGPHTIAARARDTAGGGDLTPAERAFSVDTTAVGEGGTPPATGGADLTAPELSAGSMARVRFWVGRRPTAVSAQRVPRGSAFRFSLSENAAVAIAIQRALPGRRSRGRCQKPSRLLLRAKRCTRWLSAGPALRRAASSGANRIPFSGRIGDRALRPGRYRAQIRATDAAGNTSTGIWLRFRIVG
jgi:Ca2+-binding RTX toxin-like protein